MTEPQLLQRQRAVLRTLARLVQERSSSLAAAEASRRSRIETAAAELQEIRKQVKHRLEEEHSAAQSGYELALQAIKARFDAEIAAAEQEYKGIRSDSDHRFEEGRDKSVRQYEEWRWTTTTQGEADEKAVREPFQHVQQTVKSALDQVRMIREEAEDWLRRCRQAGLIAKGRSVGKANRHDPDPERDLQACLTDAERFLQKLKGLRSSRLFRGAWLLGFLLFLWGVLAAVLRSFYPDGQVGGQYHWLLVSGAGAGLITVAAAALLYVRTRLRLFNVWQELVVALADAQLTAQRWQQQAAAAHEQKRAELKEARKRRDAQLRQAEEKHQRHLAALQQRHDQEKRDAEQKYPPLLDRLRQQRGQALLQAEQDYRRRLTESRNRHDTDLAQADARYQKVIQDGDSEMTRLQQGWRDKAQQALMRIHDVLGNVNVESRKLLPVWNDPAWSRWTPPAATPPALRFGEYRLDLQGVAGPLLDGAGWPAAVPANLRLPALLAFPERCSMLLKCRDAGRQQGVRLLQAMMFRFLTSLPPGKVRFTIVDPVGLGENFSAFMHLADYDEALVTSRIWTEKDHIEQQLADLSAHMENVIQKYLRNEYASIEEYNAKAGEVAEPFRVLVIANFPANFTPDAARRLISVATSGASCGVFVLASVDIRQPLPDGFNLADLEQSCVTLAGKDDRFVWQDPDFAGFPLQVDPPPDPSLFNPILHRVGEKARDTRRVEVPFEFIAPSAGEWWTRSSRSGIEVPLGRAGATKRQSLRLGHGTSQHVLIAGKTGSGKSTLLHVLITNLGLFYSPDEVELYLIDFKKGVEFKTYVTHRLPHARVVAIESEREFGLSVLQRLDAELKQRGERFRQMNVQNIADYRESSGASLAPGGRGEGSGTLPRILLIVDEFQEFFVEDDKIAQEAGLLLDRLVRQGRAFGLHVLLGSQTLGGAYSLARSTIDQMAVRIALQCSEADAHMILSKDNSAARLLSRPGEAIYNDANGLVEGNDIFQIVWLDDDLREQHLEHLRRLSEQRKQAKSPPIVFEGNVPADVTANPLLQQVLAAPTWPNAPRAISAWLGDAIAIKPPTAAVFRRQTSSNLLLIGQQEEAALSVLAAGLIGIAAQSAPSPDPNLIAAGTRLAVLDGTSADAPHAGWWKKLADAVPHQLQLGTWREVPAMLGEIAAEVDRRHKGNDTESPPLFLFIFGLQRFRDLRRSDDDFSFARREGKAIPPPQLLETIVREGPAVGVHTLVWCDTLTSLQRAFDRQTLRDFEMRVLFQMSTTDSSFLIDSPAASRLGLHRALFCSEDAGIIEKFRPYALPGEEWLATVKQLLNRKRASKPELARVPASNPENCGS
jgi:hypothetical protein